VAEKDGIPAVEGIESGDILVKVDDLPVKNATMGTVIDALRGKPGDTHRLILQREGKQIEAIGTVKRFL
jgi:C-terminal processing protease CtpA/Prc